MVGHKPTRELVLAELAGGVPRSSREVVDETGLSPAQVYKGLYRCWRRGLVLRTEKPIYRQERVLKGREGVSRPTRPYHLYLLRPEGAESIDLEGRHYVGYSEEHLDPRGGGGISKAQRILGFLKEHGDAAFFSRDIADTLEDYGVEVRDIMSNVRHFENQAQVYVRG